MAHLILVGSAGDGLFNAGFAGPEGRKVMFSGTIQVLRVGSAHDESRRYVFECVGHDWPAHSPKVVVDQNVNPAESAGAEVVRQATESDYYGVIVPAIRQIEKSVQAQTNPERLKANRVGLVDVWERQPA